MIILFTLDDCDHCYQEHILWNKIDESFNDEEIFIVGIAASTDLSGLKSFTEDRKINFPILIDSSDLVKLSLGFRHSPLRITVNSTNKIIDVAVTTQEYERQKHFLNNLQLWLDNEKYN